MHEKIERNIDRLRQHAQEHAGLKYAEDLQRFENDSRPKKVSFAFYNYDRSKTGVFSRGIIPQSSLVQIYMQNYF